VLPADRLVRVHLAGADQQTQRAPAPATGFDAEAAGRQTVLQFTAHVQVGQQTARLDHRGQPLDPFL